MHPADTIESKAEPTRVGSETRTSPPGAAPAPLPERDAAGRHDRPDRERRLVADTAGRVLVDDLPAEQTSELDRLAAADHRVGERERLRAREPLEVDRHQERGELVVGDLAAGVGEHELGELVRVELLAVPLALDELGGADPAARSPRNRAAGFAQRFRAVFGPLGFRARERVTMPPPGTTAPARFEVELRDLVWDWLYAPVAVAVGFDQADVIGEAVERIAQGRAERIVVAEIKHRR